MVRLRVNVTVICSGQPLPILRCSASAKMVTWLLLIPFCNFDDPQRVKVVELDDVCRAQQVNDGAFATIDDVPRHALSLTIPTIMARPRLFAIVPGPAKRQAIKNTIEGPVDTACPASILRRHPDAHLFIDSDSASLLARR